MTNYEYLLENHEELIKGIIIDKIAIRDGTPSLCSWGYCNECEFSWFVDGRNCKSKVKEWLEEEYSPYKIGDIVIDSNNQLAVVKEDDCDEGVIMISHFTDNTKGIEVHVTDIKKKVGNIYDDK
jgi:hypothetical protein